MISGNLAQAGEILGVLDPHTGVLAPTASSMVTSDAAAAPVTRLGAFKVVAQFTFGKEIPASNSGSGSVSIATNDPEFTNMVTSDGSISRSGNSGTLTLYLPYYWTVASAGETVNVFFDAYAYPNGASYSYTRSITVTLPKPGALTTLNIDAAF